MALKPDYDIQIFQDAASWQIWLNGNHATAEGLWLRIYKKGSQHTSVTYAQALDVALCYGWIDGQRKSHDTVSFLQKFTPRRKQSLWSKRNIEHIERLTRLGLMHPAGQAEVDRAQADGRWDAAYDGPRNMEMPDYFLTMLDCDPVAKTFYDTLSKSNRYTIAWSLHTAKTDATRMRRAEKFITQLHNQERPH